MWIKTQATQRCWLIPRSKQGHWFLWSWSARQRGLLKVVNKVNNRIYCILFVATKFNHQILSQHTNVCKQNPITAFLRSNREGGGRYSLTRWSGAGYPQTKMAASRHFYTAITVVSAMFWYGGAHGTHDGWQHFKTNFKTRSKTISSKKQWKESSYDIDDGLVSDLLACCLTSWKTGDLFSSTLPHFHALQPQTFQYWRKKTKMHETLSSEV